MTAEVASDLHTPGQHVALLTCMSYVSFELAEGFKTRAIMQFLCLIKSEIQWQ